MKRLCVSAIALAAQATAAVAADTAQAATKSDDWQFVAAIYGWLPEIGGNSSFPADDSSVDIDVGTLLDHLKMTGMGAFALQKGQWGAFTDLVYLNVGGSHTRDVEIGGGALPAGVSANLDFDLKAVIWTLGASYRVVASEQSTFDFLAGARLAGLKQKLDWEFSGTFGPSAPAPRTGSRETSIDQWDAIVGAKGELRLGAAHKWLVSYYMDAGAGDSELTWQGVLGVGYAFGWGDIDLVWRYLYPAWSSPRAPTAYCCAQFDPAKIHARLEH